MLGLNLSLMMQRPFVASGPPQLIGEIPFGRPHAWRNDASTVNDTRRSDTGSAWRMTAQGTQGLAAFWIAFDLLEGATYTVSGLTAERGTVTAGLVRGAYWSGNIGAGASFVPAGVKETIANPDDVTGDFTFVAPGPRVFLFIAAGTVTAGQYIDLPKATPTITCEARFDRPLYEMGTMELQNATVATVDGWQVLSPISTSATAAVSWPVPHKYGDDVRLTGEIENLGTTFQNLNLSHEKWGEGVNRTHLATGASMGSLYPNRTMTLVATDDPEEFTVDYKAVGGAMWLNIRTASGTQQIRWRNLAFERRRAFWPALPLERTASAIWPQTRTYAEARPDTATVTVGPADDYVASIAALGRGQTLFLRDGYYPEAYIPGTVLLTPTNDQRVQMWAENEHGAVIYSPSEFSINSRAQVTLGGLQFENGPEKLKIGVYSGAHDITIEHCAFARGGQIGTDILGHVRALTLRDNTHWGDPAATSAEEEKQLGMGVQPENAFGIDMDGMQWHWSVEDIVRFENCAAVRVSDFFCWQQIDYGSIDFHGDFYQVFCRGNQNHVAPTWMVVQFGGFQGMNSEGFNTFQNGNENLGGAGYWSIHDVIVSGHNNINTIKIVGLYHECTVSNVVCNNDGDIEDYSIYGVPFRATFTSVIYDQLTITQSGYDDRDRVMTNTVSYRDVTGGYNALNAPSVWRGSVLEVDNPNNAGAPTLLARSAPPTSMTAPGPREFEVHPTSATALRITWPPKRGTHLRGYVRQYRVDGGSWTNIGGQVLDVDVTSLAAGLHFVEGRLSWQSDDAATTYYSDVASRPIVLIAAQATPGDTASEVDATDLSSYTLAQVTGSFVAGQRFVIAVFTWSGSDNPPTAVTFGGETCAALTPRRAVNDALQQIRLYGVTLAGAQTDPSVGVTFGATAGGCAAAVARLPAGVSLTPRGHHGAVNYDASGADHTLAAKIETDAHDFALGAFASFLAGSATSVAWTGVADIEVLGAAGQTIELAGGDRVAYARPLDVSAAVTMTGATFTSTVMAATALKRDDTAPTWRTPILHLEASSLATGDVSSWTAITGAAATQLTAGNRPTKSADGLVHFGAGDYMVLGAAIQPRTLLFTLYIDQDASVDVNSFLIGSQAAGNRDYIFTQSGPAAAYSVSLDGATSNTGTINIAGGANQTGSNIGSSAFPSQREVSLVVRLDNTPTAFNVLNGWYGTGSTVLTADCRPVRYRRIVAWADEVTDEEAAAIAIWGSRA